MEEIRKAPNKFVRTMIVLLCLLLTSMVIFNYFIVEPQGVIGKGNISLILILVVLVLSESFDNFSLGKLLSISREAKKKEEQVKSLEKKNSDLLKQLITISNTQTQSQQHTNVYGDYYISPSEQLASKQEIEPKVDKKEVEKLLDVVGDSIVINDIVNKINVELESKGLATDTDAVKILAKHLAGTQLLLAFEQIHNVIFGSQIFLLKKLNEAAGEGKSIEYINAHIDHVRSKFSENLSSWSNEQYLAYLFSQQLIVKEENEKIHITNLGVEYLTWLVRNGRSDDKPL